MPDPAGAHAARPRQPRTFTSLDELLGELTDRRPFKTPDGLSGSRFESALYRGQRTILKYVSVDDDWIMRATGDLHCRQLTLFESGVLDRLPACVDHATLAVAPFVSPSGRRGGAFLMEDVGPLMVPPGNTVIDLDTHLRFIDHMSQMHAAYWGWDGGVELFPVMHHYVFLTPVMATIEQNRASRDATPQAVARGWARIQTARPQTHAALLELIADPAPLVSAVASTPQTLIHADWKLGNLGEHGDGRTILIDWDRSGVAPATFDLAWYLAVNCDRMPQSKEETIDAYRASLRRQGVDLEAWWHRQLALALVGAFLMLGWAKVDDPKEFGWWDARLADGLQYL